MLQKRVCGTVVPSRVSSPRAVLPALRHIEQIYQTGAETSRGASYGDKRTGNVLAKRRID